MRVLPLEIINLPLEILIDLVEGHRQGTHRCAQRSEHLLRGSHLGLGKQQNGETSRAKAPCPSHSVQVGG